MKSILIVTVALLFSCNAMAQKKIFEPKILIPDSTIAIDIALVYFKYIYGSENANRFKPYTAKLVNNKIWIVTGYLPQNMLGGVPYMEIQKVDGKVLKIAHGK